MRSVIPTRSSRAPSGVQTALLFIAGLAASLLYVRARTRRAERDQVPQSALTRLMAAGEAPESSLTAGGANARQGTTVHSSTTLH